MKKRVWIAISSILASVPLLIPSGGGHDHAPLEKWVARYNGPGNSYDDARAIAMDGSGNVYVTGESVGLSTYGDYATIKYSTNGKQLWVKRYNGLASGNDDASAIAVDGSGNVYVTGTSPGSGTYADYATIKYSTNGKQLWVERYNGPGNEYDSARAIAVDGSGNVYVTGRSMGSDTNYNCATIKYSTNGKQLWVKRYNGPAKSYGEGWAIAVDGSGNIYVTGVSENSSSHSEYITIKY
jgi:hypothetical protein